MASDGGGGGAAEESWAPRARPFSDYGSVAAQTQPQLQMFASSAAVVDQDRSSYGGGSGKWKATRKSGGRRTSLPYERPVVVRSTPSDPQAAAFLDVTGAQALAGKRGRGGAWLGSGISKIITTSATYLYSSIFRRRLPAPLQVSDVEGQDGEEQISSPSADAEDHHDGGNGQAGFAEDREHVELAAPKSSPSDLERLLKQRTLSRDEFERLTALLQSRVVTNGVEKQQQPKQADHDVRASRPGVQPSVGTRTEAQRWRQDLQKSREERENGNRTLAVYENGGPSSATPAPAPAPERLDSLDSSPVDVAIAFMGGRASQQAGTTTALEPLSQRDENRLSSGPSPALPVPQMSLSKWAVPDHLNEDQFRTPPPPALQSWGRSRTVSRTPYSRPLRLPPPRERAVDGTFGTPLSTRWTPIRTPVTGGREMLKRRSTVLDDGWTSGGPIRRTRQKAIVSLGPSSLSLSRGPSYPINTMPNSSLSALPPSREERIGGTTPSHRDIAATPFKEKDALTASGNFYVPAQSSETARKILETLEKMTPSPKGKSLGEELAYVREKPPTTLTESMLNEQARKSMAVVEHPLPSDAREPGPSTRTLETETPISGHVVTVPKASDYSTKIKGKGKASLPPTENGPTMLAGAGALHAAQGRTSTAELPVSQVSVRAKEPAVKFPTETEKRKGFQMNAVFEESGSEDEGRAGGTNSLVTPSEPISMLKPPSTSLKSSTITAPVLTTVTVSSTATLELGLPSGPVSAPAVDTNKTFTFPTTRPSLEGPPTPKAMAPASTSPGTFFQFAQTLTSQAAPTSTVEQSTTMTTTTTTVKVESQTESKAEMAFSPPISTTAQQFQPKLQPSVDARDPNPFKLSSPFSGAPSAAAPATFSTLTSHGAASSSVAEPWPASTPPISIEAPTTAPSSASPFKVGATPSAAPFLQAPSSSSLFGSGSSSVANFAGTTAMPSFPSFGAVSSASTFGASMSASMTFGSASTTLGFGSTSAKPNFGGFATEPVSQPQSNPLFGSGFAAASLPMFGSGSASVGNTSATATVTSFTSSVFGSASSGSTFRTAPAAPMAFGSPATLPAFASTSPKPAFGGFSSEPASQASSAPVFGSGFASPSIATTSTPFSFGSSSPAFAFGGAPASSSSGTGFMFGSGGSFPFSSNKSDSLTSQPSIFGLPSSAPAFGSTTNGTMASDVVVSDLSNMDDNSMAEEPPQIVSNDVAQPSPFVAQSSAGTSPFVFGAQTGAPGVGGPILFGGFPPPTNPAGFTATANPFAAPQPGGSLDFSGGSFNLGTGGDNRPARKLFKAKRTGAKRGK